MKAGRPRVREGPTGPFLGSYSLGSSRARRCLLPSRSSSSRSRRCRALACPSCAVRRPWRWSSRSGLRCRGNSGHDHQRPCRRSGRRDRELRVRLCAHQNLVRTRSAGCKCRIGEGVIANAGHVLVLGHAVDLIAERVPVVVGRRPRHSRSRRTTRLISSRSQLRSAI